MTPQALTEFRARCQTAKQYGRQIANAAGYAAELEAEAGPALPEGVDKHSAEHLIALVDKVLRVRSGEAKASPVVASAAEEAPKSKKKRKSKKSEDSDESEDEPSDD
jgi:hypothetical protein